MIGRQLRNANIPTSPRVWTKLAVIGSLYMAQTLPQAFVSQLLPAIFREQGLDLKQFWLFSLILVPGWVRWAWAPTVDRFGSRRLGRRKSWIIPCTSLGALGYLLLLAIEPSIEAIGFVIGVLIVQSVVMVTQEIAVDAYTVENLEENERGVGAGVRVFLEACAELVAMAGLAAIYDYYGWNYAVMFAAAFLFVFTVPAMIRREPPPPAAASVASADRGPSLKRFLRRRDSWLILINLIAGGLAMGIILPMLGAFLVDKGFPLSQVGLAVGLILFIGILGGVVISVPLAQTIGLKRSMQIFSLLAVPMSLPAAWAAAQIELEFWPAIFALACPTLVVSQIYVAYTTARIGWASQIQAATDYAIGTSFIKIGQTSGIALGGFLAAFTGWTLFFVAYAFILLAATVLFILTHDYLQRLIDRRNLDETRISVQSETEGQSHEIPKSQP